MITSVHKSRITSEGQGIIYSMQYKLMYVAVCWWCQYNGRKRTYCKENAEVSVGLVRKKMLIKLSTWSCLEMWMQDEVTV